MSRYDWQERTACLHVPDPEVFFADRPRGNIADRLAMEQARAICDGCPLWTACLDVALSVPSGPGNSWTESSPL